MAMSMHIVKEIEKNKDSRPAHPSRAAQFVEKVFFTAKTDKSIFCIAFSCGRRGTAVAVDEE